MSHIALRSQSRLFIVGIVGLFTIYLTAIPFMQRALETVSDSALVSVPFFLIWLVAAVIFQRACGLPSPTLGIRTITRSDLVTTGAITAVLVFAALVLAATPSSNADASIPTDHESTFALCLYVAFVPVQEYVARGILLGGLLHYFHGRRTAIISCMICALLYSTLHLYLGLYVALLVFVPGLLWSYLYYRTRSLLLVSLSHLACGLVFMHVLAA